MKHLLRIVIFGFVALVVAAALAAWFLRGPERRNVLVPQGGPEVVVMDFARPFPLDPLPDGWYHHKFWTRNPAIYAFAVKDRVPALRIETNASASMLFRRVEIDLVQYPIIEWHWLVEQGIESPLDERTSKGDDHPARLFITFQSDAGERRSMEIIWGNRLLKTGDFKYLEDFPHYVANGGSANTGRWHRQRVDLLALYRKIWNDRGGARVLDIALFCDSDETKTKSVAYFADVRMKRR